jgi:hypothetical protein
VSLTIEQRHQIDRLTIRLGVQTIYGRNQFVERVVGHPIKHLVDLTPSEARVVISACKEELAARHLEQKSA